MIGEGKEGGDERGRGRKGEMKGEGESKGGDDRQAGEKYEITWQILLPVIPWSTAEPLGTE